MISRISESDLTKPFFVEWGDFDGADEVEYNCEYFERRASAEDFVDEKTKLYAVWLGEIGIYRTEKGRPIRDWMYYWWNIGTNWGELPFHASPTEKTGYPAGAPRNLVSYSPHAVS